MQRNLRMSVVRSLVIARLLVLSGLAIGCLLPKEAKKETSTSDDQNDVRLKQVRNAKRWFASEGSYANQITSETLPFYEIHMPANLSIFIPQKSLNNIEGRDRKPRVQTWPGNKAHRHHV